MRITRFSVEPQDINRGNIKVQYEIEKAAWIWRDGWDGKQTEVVLFKRDFELSEEQTFVIHVSADQRFQLFLNNTPFALGPDRSDLMHWSFASYRITLPKGKHLLEAKVFWLGDFAPAAQTTYRPGFILAAEGVAKQILNTGFAQWQATKLHEYSFEQSHNNPVVGATCIINSKNKRKNKLCKIENVLEPLISTSKGGMRRGWRLHPSLLPDQINIQVAPGQIKAVSNKQLFSGKKIEQEDTMPKKIKIWQGLLNSVPVEIPAKQEEYILWDLENYYCGYSTISLQGTGSVEFMWVESLFDDADGEIKGNRNKIVAKYVSAPQGDHFIATNEQYNYESCWWRSGRYVILHIKSEDTPLKITNLSIQETRYPWDNKGKIKSSDSHINKIIPFLTRGFEMCSHETFIDCPYYEQLMYVGDSRLEALCGYVMSGDSRLQQRAIDLFDWSKSQWGFIAEHYPSKTPQLSTTFSLLWVTMLNDHIMWRRPSHSWIKEKLISMRIMLENYALYLNKDNLLEALPGWSFVDWPAEWTDGIPPEAEDGVSSICNLHYIFALQTAAHLESVFGDTDRKNKFLQQAHAVALTVKKAFWNQQKSLIADNMSQSSFSEHAQCLALLTDILPRKVAEKCFNSLISNNNLTRCSSYFSFYLFEVLNKYNRQDLIINKLELWQEMLKLGAVTPFERPEPSRSDCHAWSSHPLFHFFASIAGIRPAAAGFKKVLVHPYLKERDKISGELPHPDGFIKFDFSLQDNILQSKIDLPETVDGIFHYNGRSYSLNQGRNFFICKNNENIECIHKLTCN